MGVESLIIGLILAKEKKDLEKKDIEKLPDQQPKPKDSKRGKDSAKKSSQSVADAQKSPKELVKTDKEPSDLTKKVTDKTTELEEDSIDELVPDTTEEQLLLMQETTKSVDYSQLFLYLGNLKDYDFSYNTFYGYGEGKDQRMEDEQTVTNKIDDSIIYKVLRASKLKNAYGLDTYIHPTHKALFDMWKMTNDIELKLRYDMISI
ncbi:MAG: hypothetical protein ABIF10_04530 [Candidatus Woesearchaeota archaeon]